MENLSDKKRHKLYGEIAISFAYAPNTNDACTAIIEKIQKVFGFPISFIEGAKRSFPYVSELLTRQELLNCYIEMKYTRNIMNATRTPLTKEKLAKYFSNSKDGKMKTLTVTRKIRSEAEELESRLREDHGRIVHTQDEIKNVVEVLLKGESLYSTRVLEEIVDNYNHFKATRPLLSVKEDDSISYSTFSFEDLKDSDNPLLDYTSIVQYCLVEFLMNKKNRELIKRCDRCKKIFIAKKTDERIKYCPECSYLSPKSREHKNQLARDWRKRKREEKRNQELEARIDNLIRQLDVSREGAIEIIKADDNI